MSHGSKTYEIPTPPNDLKAEKQYSTCRQVLCSFKIDIKTDWIMTIWRKKLKDTIFFEVLTKQATKWTNNLSNFSMISMIYEEYLDKCTHTVSSSLDRKTFYRRLCTYDERTEFLNTYCVPVTGKREFTDHFDINFLLPICQIEMTAKSCRFCNKAHLICKSVSS